MISVQPSITYSNQTTFPNLTFPTTTPPPPPPDMQTIASLFSSTEGMPPLTPSEDVSDPASGGDASPEVQGSVITHAVRSPCGGTSSASAFSCIDTNTSPETSLACVGPALPSSVKPNNELPHNGSASNSSPLAVVAGRDGSQPGSFHVTTNTISGKPATTNVKIYKSASVRINSGTELLTAYENNNVVMLGSSKCLPYDQVAEICSQFDPLKTPIIDLKPADFSRTMSTSTCNRTLRDRKYKK